MSTIEWARPLNKSSNQQRARPMSFTSEDEIVQAEMTRGTLLLWTDHVLHSAGANRSNAPRFGAGAAYILGWLRQEENQYLAVPPETARTLPENLQKLVGYQLSGGLGFTEDVGKDPNRNASRLDPTLWGSSYPRLASRGLLCGNGEDERLRTGNV